MNSIVMDIETKINTQLVKDVIFEGRDISPEQAHKEYGDQLKAKTGSDFMPVIFHEPIVVGYVLCKDYNISKYGTLTGDDGIVKFWDAVNRGYRIVGWNSRAFDMPVLELAAMRLGIVSPDYYNSKYGARYRYSEDGHYDLYDFITNNGVNTFRGGLNAISKMIGLSGKIGTIRGHEVHKAYEDGRLQEIREYCFGDTLLTYVMWLHFDKMRGRISQDTYSDLRAKAEAILSQGELL